MLLLIAIVTVLTNSGCAGQLTRPDATPRSPLEIAELTYVQGSVFYSAALASLRELRLQERVTDAQWTRLNEIQRQVQVWAPLYSAMLNSWRLTGARPQGFDAASKEMSAAGNDVAKLLVEIKGVSQ
jgi:hypothetical protein